MPAKYKTSTLPTFAQTPTAIVPTKNAENAARAYIMGTYYLYHTHTLITHIPWNICTMTWKRLSHNYEEKNSLLKIKALLCLLNKYLVILIQNHLNYLKRINTQLSYLNRKVDCWQGHSNYRQYISGTVSYSSRNYFSFIIINDVFHDKSSIRLSFSCSDTWDNTNRKTVLEEVLRIMPGCCRIMLPAHLHKFDWLLILCSKNNTK